MGDRAALAHRQAPHVEEAALRLDGLLVRLARAQDLAQDGLGRAEAGLAQHRREGPPDRPAARAADRPLLPRAVPGHDHEVAVDDVEPDGKGVEDGPEALGLRGLLLGDAGTTRV